MLTGIFRIPDLGQTGWEEAVTKMLYKWGKCVLWGHFLPQKVLSKQLEFSLIKKARHLPGGLGWDPGSSKLSLLSTRNVQVLILSKGYLFSEFICLNPIPRVSSSEPNTFVSISWSLLYHGPQYRKGCICLFVYCYNQISDFTSRIQFKRDTHIRDK